MVERERTKTKSERVIKHLGISVKNARGTGGEH